MERKGKIHDYSLSSIVENYILSGIDSKNLKIGQLEKKFNKRKGKIHDYPLVAWLIAP